MALASFLIYEVVGVVTVAAIIDRIDLLAGLENGLAGVRRAAFSDRWLGAMALAQVASFLVAGAAFIRFFDRAYKNLLAFGYTTTHSTGWAIGVWFVPVLSFYRPKQMANEIWRKSSDASEEKPPAFLSWWWGAFLIHGLASRSAFGSVADANGDLNALKAQASSLLLANVLGFIALVLVIIVTVRLSRRQELHAAKLGLVSSPARAGSDGLRTGRGFVAVPVGAALVGTLIALPLLTASRDSDDLERAASSGDPGSVAAVGTCLVLDVDSEQANYDDQGVVCSATHDAEVFAVVTYPANTSTAFPTASRMIRFSDQACLSHFFSYTGTRYGDSDLTIGTLTPTEETWRVGDREVLCTLSLPGERLVGSRRTSRELEQVAAEKALTALAVGDCFNAPSQRSGFVVDLVSCSEPHEQEAFATLELEDRQEAEMHQFAKERCVGAFAGYTGVSLEVSELDVKWFYPQKDAWDAGDRGVVCVLGMADGTPVVGSARGPRT